MVKRETKNGKTKKYQLDMIDMGYRDGLSPDDKTFIK